MKKRIVTLAALTLSAVLLAGCQCEHEWVEAGCLTAKTCAICEEVEGEPLGHSWQEVSCAAPKTCSVCGETEGEALPHTWVEANYQDPKTCSVCGGTEGEPLTPGFEKAGFEINMEKYRAYDFYATCDADHSYRIKGTVEIVSHQVFASDDTHEAKDGYEWHCVELWYTFGDVNVYQYGTRSPAIFIEDYYESDFSDTYESEEEQVDEYGRSCFTVNYHGVDYDYCLATGTGEWGNWTKNKEIRFELLMYIRVPVGYDGLILVTFDWAKGEQLDGKTAAEVYDGNTLFFRLD